MNGEHQFVDTNVLVYAHGTTAGSKRDRALALVDELWRTRKGCVSVQVLQELFGVATRKIPEPLEISAAEQIVADLAHWQVHAPDTADVLAAIGIHRRTGASFFGRDDPPQCHSARLSGAVLRRPRLRPAARGNPSGQPLRGRLDGTASCLLAGVRGGGGPPRRPCGSARRSAG